MPGFLSADFISITARIQSAQLVPILHVNTFSISHVCGAMIYILKIFFKMWIRISMDLAVYCPIFSDRGDWRLCHLGFLSVLMAMFSSTKSSIHTGQLHLTVAWAPSKHVCPEVRPGFKPWPWAPSVPNFSLQLFIPLGRSTSSCLMEVILPES